MVSDALSSWSAWFSWSREECVHLIATCLEAPSVAPVATTTATHSCYASAEKAAGFMRWLLVDDNSLGYDFRDFEAVLAFVAAHPNDTHFIYTRSTNVPLFQETLSGPCIHYLGYPRIGPRVPHPLDNLCSALSISRGDVVSFAELSHWVRNRVQYGRALLPSGIPYFTASSSLVDDYHAELQGLADQHGQRRTIVGLVSGNKPYSDIGETDEERADEGERQSYPWAEIARVCSYLQERLFAAGGYEFVPISTQYGARSSVRRELAEVSRHAKLRTSIQVIDTVDWNDAPHQQTAFYVALKRFSAETGVKVATFGNASTYLHLMLGAVGIFDVLAVALHDFPETNPRDGRGYWESAAEHLPRLQVFRQHIAGDWDSVTRVMQAHLASILLGDSSHSAT